jgi:predicted dehydrogenase
MNHSSPDRRDFSRREFLAAAALTGAGMLVGGSAIGQPPGAAHRKRFAQVGVGGRSILYRKAVLSSHAEHCEMVGFCDTNPGRLKLAQAHAQSIAGADVPIYAATDFDRMVRETKPDAVIVTTKDAAHSDYIVRAMELGCDVLTEKPMTTDEKRCRAICDAQRKTGKRCRVTFNYRYSPPRTQVKDLLMSGAIGDVLSVDFHWHLDTFHGADYFRRWHSNKVNSGGLMVHKATHHFDLVNWWLSAVPVSVMATGKREFYTPAMAKRLGLQSHHERCLTCPEKAKCAFYLDLAANTEYRELFLEQEHYDGYFRDRCVFRPDIDIEDTMNVQVRYNTGVTMAYSLNAFNAWEGYFICFNGTKGRIEHKMEELVYVNPPDEGSKPARKEGATTIRVYPIRAAAYDVPVWKGEGEHAGGDRVMLDDLFLPQKPPDKYLRAADHRAGAYSMLVGAAANRSFISGEAVQIADLVPGIALPDYPAMPSHTEPVPMPARS